MFSRIGRNYYRVSVLVFCVASHAVALAQFTLAFDSLGLPQRWYGQFVFLLVCAVVAGAAQYVLAQRGVAPYFLQAVRLLLLILATYPLGSHLPIRATLLSALVFEIMMQIDPPVSVIAALVVVALTVALQRPHWAWEDQTTSPPLDSLLFLAFYPLVVMILGALLKQNQRMAEDRKRLVDRLKHASTSLVQTNLSLQEHILTAEEHARLRERQRISRELHDTTGYTLMNIVAMIKASVELSGSDIPRMREFLAKTAEHAQRGLQETRTALRAMRTEEREAPSLVTSVSRLAGAFRDTHIDVRPVFSNMPWSLGGEIDAAVYRLVQEGIANAIRHGNASAISVYLALDGRRFTVSVEDNGDGAAEVIPGIGITGIRERLRQLNGELEARNITGGFRLRAVIPMEPS
jgi:signal transduction histidine kinase